MKYKVSELHETGHISILHLSECRIAIKTCSVVIL